MVINYGEFTNKIDEALENIKNTTGSDVDQYVEENAELTALERIQNMMSLITNGIDWRLTTQLANAAFIVLAAGQFIKGIGSLVELGGDLKKFGGLGKLLTNKLGFGSKLASSTELTGKGVEDLNSGTSKVGGVLGGIGAVGRRYFTCSWSSFNDSRCYRISSS